MLHASWTVVTADEDGLPSFHVTAGAPGTATPPTVIEALRHGTSCMDRP
ncbi:hypothetical protein [Nonomuraea recticatena]